MHPWISIRGCLIRSMSLSVGPSIASADGVTVSVMTPPSPSLLPLTTRSGHEIAAVAFFFVDVVVVFVVVVVVEVVVVVVVINGVTPTINNSYHPCSLLYFQRVETVA